MTNKIKNVIELSTFEPNKQNPFTMVFAYPKDGAIIVKGMYNEVMEYLEKKVGLCHYNITIWKNGQSIQEWKVNHPKWRIIYQLEGTKKKYFFEYEGNVIFTRWSMPKSFIETLTCVNK